MLREHTLYLEDCLWRVRAVCGTETVADSRRVKRLHETGHPPVYYFPMEDVCQDLLEATDHTTHCPVKGDATYWSVRVGDRVAENAVWGRGAGGCRPVALFLGSDDSSYMTAANLVLDGGWSSVLPGAWPMVGE